MGFIKLVIGFNDMLKEGGSIEIKHGGISLIPLLLLFQCVWGVAGGKVAPESY